MILNMTGGAPLNFKVVGGTTQPSNPGENTIWVNTGTEVTGWVFAADQPESPSAGLVWIRTGLSSAIAFNALKKNAIQVYPICAKQYTSGAWTDVTAKSFQGGVWVDWATYLFRDGDQMTELTNGWTFKTESGSITGSVSGNAIVFTRNGTEGQRASAFTGKTIDVTNFSKLCADVVIESFGEATDQGLTLGLTSTNTSYNPTFVASQKESSVVSKTIQLDISSVSGSYYVALYSRAAAASITGIYLV